MWGLVQDGSITKIINKPKGMVIGDTRHSKKIFELWSEKELNNVGLYSVEFDDSNKRDEQWYNNTNQSFVFAGGKITASYGTATPKQLADRNATDDDGVELNPVVVIKGLKTLKKELIKQQASGLLESTDWHNHKALDDDTYTIPANIKTYRANVRTRSNEMETAIDNASDVDALKALYEYTEQADGSFARPLGEFPTLEI
jgi:hypothetical protein